MTATPSSMLPLGTSAPSFALLDVRTGKQFSWPNHYSHHHATVLMFICNHCPYVLHIQKQLVQVAQMFQKKGIEFIAISSNDVATYPSDGPEQMRSEAEKNNYTFPYLYDETQEVAKAFRAACTPDFYIFDHEAKCVYRGRFDDSTPGNHNPVTGHDLMMALNSILEKQAITIEQKPSIGCNIKWKKSM